MGTIGDIGGMLENMVSHGLKGSSSRFIALHFIFLYVFLQFMCYVTSILQNRKYKHIQYVLCVQDLLSCKSVWACVPRAESTASCPHPEQPRTFLRRFAELVPVQSAGMSAAF
jgi:hypothetical protein